MGAIGGTVAVGVEAARALEFSRADLRHFLDTRIRERVLLLAASYYRLP